MPPGEAESLSLARLLHTHVVPLLFVRDMPARGLQLLAMPYLGGAPLSAVFRWLSGIPVAVRTGADVIAALDALQAGLPPSSAGSSPWRERLARAPYVSAMCWLAACLADALQHAHERGLVHLDVKPANVLLAGEAQPLLLDFHLAQPPLDAGAVPHAFGGTAGRLAPEHDRAQEAVNAGCPSPCAVDGRADVYSLGVVLFEALAGRLPGLGEDVSRALRRENPQVSRGLADLVARALADHPAARYPDAACLAADLRRHLADEPLAGVRERSWPERWRKWRRRRPYAFARLTLLLLGLAIITGGLALAGWHFHSQRQLAEAALSEGRVCLGQGRAAEAESALRRGLAAGRFPGDGPTRAALADEAGRAAAGRDRLAVEQKRQKLLRELSDLADDLRFFHEPASLSSGDAAALERRCASLWERRELLAAGPWSEPQKRDLIDLVALWAELTPGGRVPELAEASELAGLSNGDEAWQVYRRGRSALARGRLDDAQRDLARAVALRPDAFRPNFHDGVCAYRRGQHVRAVAAFSACVATSPRAAPCYLNRALALTELGQRTDALADLDRALELDGRLASARLQRGALYAQAGQWQRAVTDLHEAIEQGADPFRARANLAFVAKEQGDLHRCRTHLREALRHRPGDEPTRRSLQALER
jgi:eukaryotic-like serine/threonine-protein kinase